jgi:hypothetical protein
MLVEVEEAPVEAGAVLEVVVEVLEAEVVPVEAVVVPVGAEVAREAVPAEVEERPQT